MSTADRYLFQFFDVFLHHDIAGLSLFEFAFDGVDSRRQGRLVGMSFGVRRTSRIHLVELKLRVSQRQEGEDEEIRMRQTSQHLTNLITLEKVNKPRKFS